MAATLKDISKATGINLCTVSQVLSNHPKVQKLKPELKERILAAAKKLNYTKNQIAATMAGKSNTVLAFVHADMGGMEYVGRIQNGVIQAANERGYTMTIHQLENFSEEELAQKLIGWRTAGVVFNISDLKEISKISKILDKENIPYGTVNLSNPAGIGVTTNDISGIMQAVQLLHENSHKKVAYAFFYEKNVKKSEYKIRRIDGFTQGMAKYYPETKNPLQLKISSEKYMERDYMLEILDQIRKKNIDGIVCETDTIAVALNNIAVSAGFAMPQTFSIIGFGGSRISETTFPQISTIIQDYEEMGRLTATAVIDVCEKRSEKTPQNMLLSVNLLNRNSVMNRETNP